MASTSRKCSESRKRRDVNNSAWAPYYHKLLGLVVRTSVVYIRPQEIVP